MICVFHTATRRPSCLLVRGIPRQTTSRHTLDRSHWVGSKSRTSPPPVVVIVVARRAHRTHLNLRGFFFCLFVGHRSTS